MMLCLGASAEFLACLTGNGKKRQSIQDSLFLLRGSFDKNIPWDFWTALANTIVIGNCLGGIVEYVVAERCIIVK